MFTKAAKVSTTEKVSGSRWGKDEEVVSKQAEEFAKLWVSQKVTQAELDAHQENVAECPSTIYCEFTDGNDVVIAKYAFNREEAKSGNVKYSSKWKINNGTTQSFLGADLYHDITISLIKSASPAVLARTEALKALKKEQARTRESEDACIASLLLQYRLS